jgi:hypothetical protein
MRNNAAKRHFYLASFVLPTAQAACQFPSVADVCYAATTRPPKATGLYNRVFISAGIHHHASPTD